MRMISLLLPRLEDLPLVHPRWITSLSMLLEDLQLVNPRRMTRRKISRPHATTTGGFTFGTPKVEDTKEDKDAPVPATFFKWSNIEHVTIKL
mmetsp:Transcript_4373/g.6702  ORF Transcript_4373/g.6702 Transcript_4373/m.6702 type:complete len:92 (+) Transcript_4373:442-717(+)